MILNSFSKTGFLGHVYSTTELLELYCIMFSVIMNMRRLIWSVHYTSMHACGYVTLCDMHANIMHLYILQCTLIALISVVIYLIHTLTFTHE